MVESLKNGVFVYFIGWREGEVKVIRIKKVDEMFFFDVVLCI